MTLPVFAPTSTSGPGSTVAIVGAGRMGHALMDAFRAAGLDVTGPHGRGSDGGTAHVVLLCVPDAQIGDAASAIRPGPYVGHCSGASTLSVLTGVDPGRRFSVHPLTTVAGPYVRFTDVPAAVAGTTPQSLAVARRLATSAGMTCFTVADEDRAAYHAGASMASNFLVTVQWSAARLLHTAGVPAAAVQPLARQALQNWASLGPASLTGPVARGDAGTVAAQRVAVAERTPDLVTLFDELVRATHTLARSASSTTAPPDVDRPLPREARP